MFSNSLGHYFKKGLFLTVTTLFLSGCFGNTSTVETTTQDILFDGYEITIPDTYSPGVVGDRVDPRVADKLIAIYSSDGGEGFSDNIVISTDKLNPNASLEDYVQASIGGMSYTRGQYKSINFQKGVMNCNALSISTISNTFSIYRTTSATNSSETLYFVQHYIYKLGKVVTISASTSNKDNVTSLEQMMDTISCNLDIK